MQDLEKTEPYKQVRREDARDVDAADLQNFLARHLQTEEERNRDEKNGERARMHAVQERRN